MQNNHGARPIPIQTRARPRVRVHMAFIRISANLGPVDLSGGVQPLMWISSALISFRVSSISPNITCSSSLYVRLGRRSPHTAVIQIPSGSSETAHLGAAVVHRPRNLSPATEVPQIHQRARNFGDPCTYAEKELSWTIQQ